MYLNMHNLTYIKPHIKYSFKTASLIYIQYKLIYDVRNIEK